MKTRFLSRYKVVVSVGCCGLYLAIALPSGGQTPPSSPPPGAPVSVASAPATYSPGMDEVVKLAQAGVSKDVLISYVNNSPNVYHPTADEIVYLNDLGVSDEVINALLKKTTAGVGFYPTPAPAPSAPAPAIPAVASAPSVPAVPPPGDAPFAPTAPGFVDSTPPVPMAPPPTAEDTVSYFYDSLSPYGNWVNEDDYGLCWQPSVVIANPYWRPYYDHGHWVYSDSGWYWVSDYSWGWAPFHYGRWTLSGRHGWVWVPDHVWGPSWVSWRYSNEYCGWAPLPPRAVFDPVLGLTWNRAVAGVGFEFGLGVGVYAFVPVGHFCDRDFHRWAAPVAQNTVIIRNTTVVNNYSVSPGHTVVNHGFPREHIVNVAHVQVPTVKLQDSHFASLGAAPGQSRGNVLPVYRPAITRGAVAPKTAPLHYSQPTGTTPRPVPQTHAAPSTAYSNPNTGFGQPNNSSASRAWQSQPPASGFHAQSPAPAANNNGGSGAQNQSAQRGYAANPSTVPSAGSAAASSHSPYHATYPAPVPRPGNNGGGSAGAPGRPAGASGRSGGQGN